MLRGTAYTLRADTRRIVIPCTLESRPDFDTARPQERWLHYAAVLLLRLSAESPNYKSTERLFAKGLRDNLRLEDYHVQPTVGSASLAMLPWGTQQALLGITSQEGDGGGMLRATQEALFSQTQDGAGGGGANATYSSQGGGVLFAPRRVALPAVPRFSQSVSATQSDDTPRAAFDGSARLAGVRFAKKTFESDPTSAMRARAARESKRSRDQVSGGIA